MGLIFSPSVSPCYERAVLLDYLRSYYGPALLALPPDAPVWISLSEVPMNQKQLARWERLGKPQHLP
jgi:hypothetical protein